MCRKRETQAQGRAGGMYVLRALVEREWRRSSASCHKPRTHHRGGIQLTVAPHNEAAQKLYRAAGFVEYAREPRSLKSTASIMTRLLMTLPYRTCG